jgi:hypothetical protein
MPDILLEPYHFPMQFVNIQELVCADYVFNMLMCALIMFYVCADYVFVCADYVFVCADYVLLCADYVFVCADHAKCVC